MEGILVSWSFLQNQQSTCANGDILQNRPSVFFDRRIFSAVFIGCRRISAAQSHPERNRFDCFFRVIRQQNCRTGQITRFIETGIDSLPGTGCGTDGINAFRKQRQRREITFRRIPADSVGKPADAEPHGPAARNCSADFSPAFR